MRNLPVIKWKLTHGAGQMTVYLITDAIGKGNQLAIMHCANLKQPFYRDRPMTVYGIAEGYEEARQMIVRISDEACRAGYTGQLKAYLDAAVDDGEEMRTETGDGR